MRLSKKRQKQEDEIKRKLTEANKYWIDWKFQIHYNKLEWVNPRIHDERKNPFCVSSKNIYKDNIETAHWVGNSQLIFLDTYDLLKITPVVDETYFSVTGNKM